MLTVWKRCLIKYLDMIFILAFPCIVCAYLWHASDLVPYGTPLNELSDHHWGIVMDIARQWKTGAFSFWTRSIGGGFCLYSSGFYPLWVPFNIAAKFLSYDHFYLFKMIEPYFLGLGSMVVLLRLGLRLSYPLVCYGALAYTGFVFTRHVAIIHHPFFLWACALFPLITYVYIKLFRQHIYLRSTVLGAFMALVFMGGGAGQFVQMIIWGAIVLVGDALFFVEQKSWLRKMMLAAISCIIFSFFSFSLAAVQLLPTMSYTLLESIRTLGEYPINNFPIFRNDYKGVTSISGIFTTSIFFDNDSGVRAFWALMIFAVGKVIVDWKLLRQWCLEHKAILNISLATVLFFLIPPIAELLSYLGPFFARVFHPLRMFTFGYCGFMLDFVLVLFLVVVLNINFFTQRQKLAYKNWQIIVLIVSFIIAEVYLFAPLWASQLFPQIYNGNFQIGANQRYLAIVVLLLLGFHWQWVKLFQKIIVLICFVFLGWYLLLTSYQWGEKGRQTAFAQYHFGAPEHRFYQRMKNHYYLAYVDPLGQTQQYSSMTHNYDLLFEVNGVNGFLNIPPKRFSNFLNAYHQETYWTKNLPAYKYRLQATPAALTTHFPVELTTVEKGTTLPWPNFSKAIDGAKYDVWTRDTPPPQVQFAHQIKVVSFRELITAFDRSYDQIIYMTSEDANKYFPQQMKISADSKKSTYRNFNRVRPDFLTFEVNAADNVFVLLPEMFQAGWQLRVDGQRHLLFPAQYIFMGFQLDKGEHVIELEYRPVLWRMGILINLLGIGLFAGMIYYYLRLNKRQRSTSYEKV